jgi:hypothetical protein
MTPVRSESVIEALLSILGPVVKVPDVCVGLTNATWRATAPVIITNIARIGNLILVKSILLS